ncbi:MAG: alpha/beta hydrolase [Planctomycetaceae bacterium]|nr:alpha/beta hydrolase [Planctomycetaceae bacterium]
MFRFLPSRFVLLAAWFATSSSLPLFGSEPTVLKVWPDQPPGPQALVDGPEIDRQQASDRLVGGKSVMKLGNVSSPEVHLFRPDAAKANGAACVVCPGGGFSILAWDLEGTEVADWLTENGVTAIVLKYRVPTRAHDAPGKWQGPVMDAQRALSLVRTNAEEWQIDPERIGILGFSAGGETASLAACLNGERLYDALDATDEQSCAANFAVLIYPGGVVDRDGTLREEYKVNEQTPPMFFAHAADDRVTCEASVQLFLALKRAKVPAELHVYRDGGHGYGLRPTEARVTRWPQDALAWMQELGFLNGKVSTGSTQ